MAHHSFAKAGIVAAAGAVSIINEWVTIAAGAATVVASTVAVIGSRRRRRRTRPPIPPPRLPTRRVTREEYARQLAAWDLYQAKLDQYFEDQEGQQ